MRIFYDGMIYRVQSAGGVNRYFANLINGLPEQVCPILTSDAVRRRHFPTTPRLRLFQAYQQRTNYLSRRLLALYFRAVTQTASFDIAHPTYYSLLTRLPMKAYRCPVVITVYDMIHELFAAEMDPDGNAAAEKRQAVAQAQAIICISENTRQDLLEIYPMSEGKTVVIPLAADLAQDLSYGSEPVPERPYFFYVGHRTGYKNFSALATAFARVAPGVPDIILCVTGPAFSSAELAVLAEKDIAHRIVHYGYVSDTHLAKLYRCCMAFVYPSLYEGFGLPVLEAMACGAAVIASRRASIPEVAGNAAYFFDPARTDALTDALQFILDDEETRRHLAAKGLARSKEFSWHDTVARTVDVYKTLSH